jgi:hypothetical protein
MRRIFATSASIAILATLGSAALTPESVSAATNPSVTACFVHTNGAAYHESVFFQEQSGSSWDTLGTTEADFDGCATFLSNPNRTVHMYAYEQVGKATFKGSTGAHEVGTEDVHLGTYEVKQYGSN